MKKAVQLPKKFEFNVAEIGEMGKYDAKQRDEIIRTKILSQALIENAHSHDRGRKSLFISTRGKLDYMIKNTLTIRADKSLLGNWLYN